MVHLRSALAIVGACWSLQCLSAPAAQPAAPGTPASAPAPAFTLTEGALPNGVHYLILPHLAPRGGISLRLVVASGSLDEHDDERGFAHFVEHLAFDGTPHHPPGTLAELFQRLGLTLGADLNASTSYTHTLYKLDLPADRADHLGTALELLRDYADGLAFLPAEVEKEKGVILSEIHARDTASSRTNKEITRLLYADTLVAERDAGGVPSQIETATREALRAFYLRCYRPERMTVIVVGQVEPAAVAARISAQFGSLASAGDAPPVVEVGIPPVSHGPRAHLVTNPSTGGGASLSLIAVAPTPADTAAGWRQTVIENIATSALQRRIQERREKNLTQYGPCGAAISYGIDGRFVQHAIEIQASAARWDRAVAFAESELRRARVQGFDETEIKEATASLLTRFRNRVSAEASASTQQLAGELSADVTSRSRWKAPAGELAFVEGEIPTITPAEITAAVATMIPEESSQLILRVLKPIEDWESLAVAAYQKSAREPLPAAQAATTELQFRYENFGPPGRLASEKLEADLGLRLATFANGVQLNLRPSTLEPDRFHLVATLGRGIFDLPKSRPGLGQFATLMILANDLGRHSQTEIGRLMKLHGIGFTLTYANTACTAVFSGPSEELPFTLRFLTALISDVKLDPARQPSAYSSYAGLVRSALSNPGPVAQIGALYKLSDGDPRFFTAPAESVVKYRFSEVFDWIHRSWLEGPLEIGIAGDFKIDEILAAAAGSVGTLSPRARRTPPKKEELLVLTTGSGKQVTRTKLAAGAAAAFLMWPAPAPVDPRNDRALQLAADVLMDRMRVKIREELGATYSPQTGMTRNRLQRDFGYVWAGVTFEPKQASAFTDKVIAIADDLAKNGVTAEELDRLKEPRRTTNAQQMRDTAWWLGAVVCCAQSCPGVLEEARGHLTGYDSITADDVNRAARILSEDAVTAVVVLPAPADPAAKP